MVKRLLGAATVLLSLTIPASAAAISTAPAETASLLLIGAGLILGATVTRLGARRR
jgi:hypothetical protein